MRVTVAIAMVAMAAALAGCGSRAERKREAKPVDFTPPSVLSRLDYGGFVERRFHALDRNGDDAITANELPSQDSRLLSLDANHDGKITAIEWSDGMLARFDRLDRNHDGSVTSEERDAARHR